MAGIGFELRKLLQGKDMNNKFWGYTSATFITSGPMLISIGQLLIIDKILSISHVLPADRAVIKAALLYAYVFSMIMSSGFVMLSSRFIADKIFTKELDDILPSLLGTVSIALIFGGSLGVIFYMQSPLPFLQKYFAYMIYMSLITIYVIMGYVSAIKNYKMVMLSFGSGIITTLIFVLIFFNTGVHMVTATLAGIFIGYLVNIAILLVAMMEYFEFSGGNVFAFLPYFKKYYKLFLINLFYTMGLFVHNMVFWKFSILKAGVGGTFVYAPQYDMATFFAVLGTIPASVIFITRFETAFYERYREFCRVIIDNGNLKELMSAKEKMLDTLKKEFKFLIQMQLIITALMIVLGVYVVLPLYIKDPITVDIYSFLAIGFFASYSSFLLIVVLIYFDIQSEALIAASSFFILSTLLSFLDIKLGIPFYGLGYSLASLMTFAISLYFVNREVSTIDYRMFSQ